MFYNSVAVFAAADKELSSAKLYNDALETKKNFIYGKIKQDWPCYGALKDTRNYLLKITSFIIYENTLILVCEIRKITLFHQDRKLRALQLIGRGECSQRLLTSLSKLRLQQSLLSRYSLNSSIKWIKACYKL